MKKNDFEYVKERFDCAAPQMTDKMDSAVLRRRILESGGQKVVQIRRKKRSYKPFAAVACLVVVFALCAFAYQLLGESTIDGFQSTQEINSRISMLKKEPSISERGCAITGSYLQIDETGAEKPTAYTTDGTYIYYYTVDGDVLIYTMEGTFVHKIAHAAKATPDMYLFVFNNRLTVFGYSSEPEKAAQEHRDFNTVTLCTYDISDKQNPVLLGSYTQCGEFGAARRTGSTIYLTTSYNVETNDTSYTIPWATQNGKTTYADAKDIVCFENAKTAKYAVIGAIDMNTGLQTGTLKAVLGGSAKTSYSNGYLFINEYLPGELDGEPQGTVQTAIKLNLDKSTFTYASEKELAAHANRKVQIGNDEQYYRDIYAFGEYYIGIGKRIPGENENTQIVLLDQDLKVIDTMELSDSEIYADTNAVKIDAQTGQIILPISYVTQDDEPFYFGAMVIGVTNGKLEILQKSKSTEPIDGTFWNNKLIWNGYVYDIQVNWDADENIMLEIHSCPIDE